MDSFDMSFASGMVIFRTLAPVNPANPPGGIWCNLGRGDDYQLENTQILECSSFQQDTFCFLSCLR